MADHVHNEDWSDLQWAEHLAEAHDDRAAIPGLNLIMAVGGEWNGLVEHDRLHVAMAAARAGMTEDEYVDTRDSDYGVQEAVQREPGSLGVGAMAAIQGDVGESGVFPIVSADELEVPGTGVPMGEGIEVPIGETATLSAEDEVQSGWGLVGTGPVLLAEEEAVLRTGEGAQFLIPWANAREAGLTVYFRSGLRPWARPFADGGGCAIVTEVPSAVVAAVQAALRRAAALFENGDAAVYVWEADLPEPRTETVTGAFAKMLQDGEVAIPGYAVQSVEYRRDGTGTAVVTLLPVEPDSEASPDPAEVHADDEVDRLLAEVEGRTRAAMAEGEPDPRGYGIGQMGGLPDYVAPSRGAPKDGAEALQALRRYRDAQATAPDPDTARIGDVVGVLVWLRPMVETMVDALADEGMLGDHLSPEDAVDAVLKRWVPAAALAQRWGAPSIQSNWAEESWEATVEDPTEALSPGDHYTEPQA